MSSLPWLVWGMSENGWKSPIPQELRLETDGGEGSKQCLGPTEGRLGKLRQEEDFGKGLTKRRDLDPRGAWQALGIEGRAKAKMLKEEWTQWIGLCGK